MQCDPEIEFFNEIKKFILTLLQQFYSYSQEAAEKNINFYSHFLNCIIPYN